MDFDSRLRNPYWLIVCIANTNKQVLDEIQKIIGGKVLFHLGGSKTFMEVE